MGRNEEFCTFNETLTRLGINESKLKRIVSEGEIRAFREGDQMMFRKADIEHLFNHPELLNPPTTDESGAVVESEELPTDDLIFDEGDDLDLSAAERALGAVHDEAEDLAPAPVSNEYLLHAINELRQSFIDLLPRIRALEDWQAAISEASGRPHPRT